MVWLREHRVLLPGVPLRPTHHLHTGAASARDVLRMLARGCDPTQLGEALAPYRAEIKGTWSTATL